MGMFDELTEADKNAAPDPGDVKKYKEYIRIKEEEFKKIEERDSVANLEAIKSVHISKDTDYEEIDESEEDSISSIEFSSPPSIEEPPPPQLPEFDSPKRGRPPGSKSARSEDVFNMLLSNNAVLNNINQRLSILEANQKKMAEFQVKSVCDYVHADHEQLIRRIKELLSKPVEEKPSREIEQLRIDIAQAFEDSDQKLDSYNERLVELQRSISETTKEVSALTKVCETAIQKPTQIEKKKPVHTDSGSLFMQAFNSVVMPPEQPEADDYVRLERVFDLALQKANTDNKKATDLFVSWLSQFKNQLLDNEKMPRTVQEFYRFVTSL